MPSAWRCIFSGIESCMPPKIDGIGFFGKNGEIGLRPVSSCIFLGQALAILVFSIPLLVVAGNHGSTWTAWELLGIVVWVVGVGGESLADYQLNRFRRNPENNGKVCREGLWRYSRHPNYFFDVVYWCAYVVMSIGVPDWWLTLIGPVVMSGALLKVTGIPLAEAQAIASRGEAYREYQRTTSVFIPWFPKR